MEGHSKTRDYTRNFIRPWLTSHAFLLVIAGTASAMSGESFNCSAKAAGFTTGNVKKIDIEIDGQITGTIDTTRGPMFTDPKAHPGSCFAINGSIVSSTGGDSYLITFTPENYGQTHKCIFFVHDDQASSAPPKPEVRDATLTRLDDVACTQNATPHIVPGIVIIIVCFLCIRFM